MKTLHQRGDVENQDAERVINLEVEAGPVWIVKHQLDVGPLRDDFIKPALFQVVAIDAVVELAGLSVSDPVEVHAVEVLKSGELIAIEAGGAGIDKIMLGLRPPIVKLLSRLPRRQRMVPSVVAVTPQPRQVHAPPVLRFQIT